MDPVTGEPGLRNLGQNLNPVQMTAMDLWCVDWRNGDFSFKPGLREDVLKARQEGMSTLILALIFINAVNKPHSYMMIMAHDGESTERLFMIVSRFYENLPEEKKPELGYNSRRELTFSIIDSGIYVAQAGQKNAGRSGSYSVVHMSERALWAVPQPGPAELQAGLLNTVPMNGCAFKETTAGGFNEYYHEYQRELRGESAFTPRFFGWNLHPAYRMWPPHEKHQPWHRTEEEEDLAARYGLNDEQLAWRRWKIGESSLSLFRQEYPINSVEAFQASEVSCVFDTDYLMDLHNEEVELFSITKPGDYDYIHGVLEVYERPIPGVDYVAGADVAEGIQDDGGDHDYSTALFLREDTGEEVATYYGREGCDPKVFANDLYWIGSRYNWALLCPERNNHGILTVDELRTLGYKRLYKYKVKRQRGLRTQQVEETQYGYPTNAKTKAYGDMELEAAIKASSRGDRGPIFRSKRTIMELMSYVNLKGNKRGARPGYHDDMVTSARLANLMLKREWGFSGRPPEAAMPDRRYTPGRRR